jgi:flagellar basal-body rod modification protein FlgD
MSQSITAQTGAAAAASSAAGGQSGNGALGSLTDNYQSFLQMLMTQLKNQDPTSPMDSGQFTTELVQFAGVEQQINTNSNLTQLIQATQGNSLIQASQLVGKQVEVTSNALSLQNGAAGISFTAAAAGPTAISIVNSAGQQVYSATVNAVPGVNNVSWAGQSLAGTTEPDGVYGVSVAAVGAGGSATPLPVTITGTVTSVQGQGSAVQLQLGQLSVALSAVDAVVN